MKPTALLEAFIEKKIGLAAGTIGEAFFEKVIARRMAAHGLSAMQDYLDLLQASTVVQNELIEELTIPETWFFRNRMQLEYLASHIRDTWVSRGKEQDLRILSIPCASGEEPYTIAMLLFDAGFSRGYSISGISHSEKFHPEKFHIDAVDINSYVLKKAEAAIYDETSFRGTDLNYRDRYFEKIPEGYRLVSAVGETVTFLRGNIIDERFLINTRPYDIIFCRNLFIYLSSDAKRKASNVLLRLLAQDGILFMGHTEEFPFNDLHLERIQQSGVFAYRRINATGKPTKAEAKVRHLISKPSTDTPPDIPTDTRKNSRCLDFIPDTIPKPLVPAKTDFQPTFLPDEKKPPTQITVDLMDLFGQARYLADQGDLDKALALCEEIIKGDSCFTEAYFLQGVICSAKDENNRARNYFSRVLYLDPGHMDALHHLLILAEQVGDREQAIRIKERIKRVRNKTEAD